MHDIAEQVAAWENETTVQALTSDELQRADIPLYQSHLPKLDEEGAIEYNKNRGIVENPARDGARTLSVRRELLGHGDR